MDGNMTTITLINAGVFLVAIIAIGNLIIGAFLNARRETKGKPKKNRKSMIIFDIAMVALCLVVSYYANLGR